MDAGKSHERCGTIHLVHCWHQQGTSTNDLIGPSKDMADGVMRTQANRAYFQLTREVAIIVAERFKAVFPDCYKQYEEEFEAGVWLRADPGPFLGRAVVYKLQLFPHRDVEDGGPTATFPVGSYLGGAFCFPDLGAKYRYGPGDLCIARFSELYHTVEEWFPKPCSPELEAKRITPGRISTVFFSPAKSGQTLAGKPPGWAAATAGGLFPYSVQVHGAPASRNIRKHEKRRKGRQARAERNERKKDGYEGDAEGRL
ncbi:hypothetical protein B0H11DRAFT_1756720 [Mycena galericulata]|nr:hypothetical protein B0H11DRAFT_1756720 [Mycena galericulata]